MQYLILPLTLIIHLVNRAPFVGFFGHIFLGVSHLIHTVRILDLRGFNIHSVILVVGGLELNRQGYIYNLMVVFISYVAFLCAPKAIKVCSM